MFLSAPWSRGLCLFLLGLAACSETDPSPGGAASGGASGAHSAGASGRAPTAGAGDERAGASGTSDAGAGSDGGSAGSADQPATYGGSAGSGGAVSTAGTAGEPVTGSGGREELMVPCEVYAAYSVCRNCHTDPPLNNAPMALLTLEDLQAWLNRERNAISNGTMPAQGTLSADDQKRILDWLDAGANGVPKARCP